MAVERATVLVGPALILTSVVLACGLAVTVFSDLPSLRLFGWLSAFAMIAALVADLLILRPTAMFLINLSLARSRPGEARRSERGKWAPAGQNCCVNANASAPHHREADPLDFPLELICTRLLSRAGWAWHHQMTVHSTPCRCLRS